jgi:hypothetical protein
MPYYSCIAADLQYINITEPNVFVVTDVNGGTWLCTEKDPANPQDLAALWRLQQLAHKAGMPSSGTTMRGLTCERHQLPQKLADDSSDADSIWNRGGSTQ